MEETKNKEKDNNNEKNKRPDYLYIRNMLDAIYCSIGGGGCGYTIGRLYGRGEIELTFLGLILGYWTARKYLD